MGGARRGRFRPLVATVIMLSVLGVTACGRGPHPVPVSDGGSAGGMSGNQAGIGPVTAATPSATLTTSPRPSARPTRAAAPRGVVKVTPKPVPTAVAVPPPPHSPAATSAGTPSPGASCPTYAGTNATTSEVKSALLSAGATQYWSQLPASQLPSQLNGGPPPPISVPPNLMEAVAWQESGWQSAIVACDGGVGTMQIMSDTATWMNNRFDTSYDFHTLSGNTAIGAEYLEWLVMYFGLFYFDNSFDLSNTQVTNSGHTLLDAVVASYNYGAGAVGQQDGTITIPNPGYVDDVESLMTTCVCLSY